MEAAKGLKTYMRKGNNKYTDIREGWRKSGAVDKYRKMDSLSWTMNALASGFIKKQIIDMKGKHNN